MNDDHQKLRFMMPLLQEYLDLVGDIVWIYHRICICIYIYIIIINQLWLHGIAWYCMVLHGIFRGYCLTTGIYDYCVLHERTNDQGGARFICFFKTHSQEIHDELACLSLRISEITPEVRVQFAMALAHLEVS